MRICFLLFLIFSATVFVTSAQRFEGGMLAGIAATQVAGDTYSGYDKAGLFAGAFIRLEVSEKWRLQMELEFIQKGSRHNYDPDKVDDIDYLFRTNYLEMPVLLQYDMSTYIPHLHVQGGLGFAVLAAHKELRNDEDIKSQQPKVLPTNLSFIAGVCYQLGPRLSLDFRTDNSLLTIRDGQRQGYVRRISREYGQFHDALVISFFYRF